MQSIHPSATHAAAEKILRDLPQALMLALPNRRLMFVNARAAQLFSDSLAVHAGQRLMSIGQLRAERIDELLRRAVGGQRATSGLWFAPGFQTGWLDASVAPPSLLHGLDGAEIYLLLLVHLDQPSLTQSARIEALSSHYRLTLAERQVLMLLADGASVDAAARQLGLQISTLRSHVRKLLTKSGAPSLMQLMRWLGSAVPSP